MLTEKEIDGSEALIRERTGNRSLVLFDSGDEVTVQAGEEGIRFLLVSGKPLREPVWWYGPIVMNTQAELRTGGLRASERDLHQERLSRHSMLQLYRSSDASCARDPAKREIAAKSVNSICGLLPLGC